MLYLSEKTGKSYKTVKELEADEKALVAKEEEQKKLSLEKKERADEVGEAYKEYEKLKVKFAKELDEAYGKYEELRDRFAKDYGGYHMTYTCSGDEEPKISFSSLVDCFFNL